jgi:hypothetical protein
MAKTRFRRKSHGKKRKTVRRQKRHSKKMRGGEYFNNATELNKIKNSNCTYTFTTKEGNDIEVNKDNLDNVIQKQKTSNFTEKGLIDFKREADVNC